MQQGRKTHIRNTRTRKTGQRQKIREKTVLFSDDVIIYAENPKITAKDFLEHGGHRM